MDTPRSSKWNYFTFPGSAQNAELTAAMRSAEDENDVAAANLAEEETAAELAEFTAEATPRVDIEEDQAEPPEQGYPSFPPQGFMYYQVHCCVLKKLLPWATLQVILINCIGLYRQVVCHIHAVRESKQLAYSCEATWRTFKEGWAVQIWKYEAVVQGCWGGGDRRVEIGQGSGWGDQGLGRWAGGRDRQPRQPHRPWKSFETHRTICYKLDGTGVVLLGYLKTHAYGFSSRHRIPTRTITLRLYLGLYFTSMISVPSSCFTGSARHSRKVEAVDEAGFDGYDDVQIKAAEGLLDVDSNAAAAQQQIDTQEWNMQEIERQKRIQVGLHALLSGALFCLAHLLPPQATHSLNNVLLMSKFCL